MKRRNFLSASGLATLPLLAGLRVNARSLSKPTAPTLPVNMILDGYFFDPAEYLSLLVTIESESGINGDFYSQGGVVSELEKQFCAVTGKEAAIYMPSGTMANELTLRLLCGNKTKAIVHEESHIFRDEGDAAQAIHNKRLVPIKTGKHFFSLEDLTKTIRSMEEGEVFYDGVGALSIENPVRRHNGRIVDMKHIREVTQFARENGIKTHLDGARIHLASAYSGIPVKEYAAHFDTVYISLYKYLGAAGGAILCGDKDTLEGMRHYIKILGGTVFRSWTNAAVAHYFLQDLDQRMKEMVTRSEALVQSLQELDELEVEKVPNGTNIVFLKSDQINLETFAEEINETHGIWMNYPENGKIQLHLNESQLQWSKEEWMVMIKEAIRKSKG